MLSLPPFVSPLWADVLASLLLPPRRDAFNFRLTPHWCFCIFPFHRCPSRTLFGANTALSVDLLTLDTLGVFPAVEPLHRCTVPHFRLQVLTTTRAPLPSMYVLQHVSGTHAPSHSISCFLSASYVSAHICTCASLFLLFTLCHYSTSSSFHPSPWLIPRIPPLLVCSESTPHSCQPSIEPLTTLALRSFLYRPASVTG